MSVLYQNPTYQSVQSQRQVYKKGETKSIMCRFAKKCYILESDVWNPLPFMQGDKIMGKLFWCEFERKHKILHYNSLFMKDVVGKIQTSYHENIMRLQGANGAKFEYFSKPFFFSRRHIGLGGYCAADSRTGNKWEIIATAVPHFKGNWARKYSLMVQSTDSPCSNSFFPNQ